MSNLLDTLLTRREAFKVGASLVSAYWFLPLVNPINVHAQAKVNPRGSARFVIFVMLEGGQSHVDTWDLKEGKWTPQNFDILIMDAFSSDSIPMHLMTREAVFRYTRPK